MIKDRLGREITKEIVFNYLTYSSDGVTVWDMEDAYIYRAINENQKTRNLVTLVKIGELEKILGYEFDPIERIPYFGVITTEEGKEWMIIQLKQTRVTVITKGD